MLNEPLTAKKMRFEPVTGQGSQICTSLEVYRGDKEGNLSYYVFQLPLNYCMFTSRGSKEGLNWVGR